MAVHIDLRSAKVTELLAEPRATLLIWEQKARLQIRLRVQVEVKSGQTVTADWQRVPEIRPKSLWDATNSRNINGQARADHSAVRPVHVCRTCLPYN